MKLKNSPTGDYIHANYVEGFKSVRKYICTQGPLDDTVADFWRMIWDEKVVVVVMLTGIKENEENKCATYFPNGVSKKMHHAEFRIETIASTKEEISEHQKVRVRILKITSGGCARVIEHIQYIQWPDHGVPNSKDFVKTLSFVHKAQVSPSFFILFL